MVSSQDSKEIRTRFLILSETHGKEFPPDLHPQAQVDVAIHCGDLTEASLLTEFGTTLKLLQVINAPLRLVIVGNHDFTLDTPAFTKILEGNPVRLEPEDVRKHYGEFDEARKLLTCTDARNSGIIFLGEGTHYFDLANGARFKVYASPYTPSTGNMGFQYPSTGIEDHAWLVEEGKDIVITHGPPRGILDRSESRRRTGSPSLFSSIARVRPRLHCFGHVHEGWGAKLVTWRDKFSETPSHFTDIDNDESTVIETLATMRPGKFDTPDIKEDNMKRALAYSIERVCTASHSTRGLFAQDFRLYLSTLLYKAVRRTRQHTCPGWLISTFPEEWRHKYLPSELIERLV
ncbi:Fc.00g074550.m01.CDS01 [Cosmosporella sp. VM-42]